VLSVGAEAVSHSDHAVADPAPPVTTPLTLAPIADAYVSSAAPRHSYGTSIKLDASNSKSAGKASYLRFQVPPSAQGRVVAATLVLTRTTHHLSGTVYARAAGHQAWSERTITASSAPKVGGTLAAQWTNANTRTVSLDVLGAVQASADVTVAVTSSLTTGVATFRSREYGSGSPQLRLKLRKPRGPVIPTATPTAGTSSAASSTSPTASPTAPGTPTTAAGSTPAGASTTTPALPTDTPNAQPPVASRACVSDPMGIPSAGAYAGAAVSGTQTLAGLESSIGGSLPIYRNYFSATQVNYAITSVRADLAAGRLPWISFKLPYSWADMANGRGDAWATDLADKLATVGGPVWLAFHHEPEGDGSIQDWVRMQQHLAPIIHAHTNNVAYTVIYTGWDIFFGDTQYALAKIWPGQQYVDILGVDMYNDYGTNRNGNTNIAMLDSTKYYSRISTFAAAHSVGWAIGETGYTPAAAKVDPTWLTTSYQQLRSAGGLAMAYFDSSLNSIADWTLDDPVRLNAFKTMVAQSPRIC
jgi:hypothetical protein